MKSVLFYGVLIGILMAFSASDACANSLQNQLEMTDSPLVLAQSGQGQAPSDAQGGAGYGYQRPYTPRYTDPYRYRSPAYRRGYQYGYREERGTDDPASRGDYRTEYGPRYRDENRYYGNRYRSYDGRYYGPRGPYGSPYRRYPGFGPFGPSAPGDR